MKRNYWIILVTTLVLLAALILSACGGPAPATQAPAPTSAAPSPTQVQSSPTAAPPAQTKTLKFSYAMPKGSAIANGFEWFAAELPKRSNGHFKVETYPSSSLIGVPVAFDSAKKGVAEIVMTSSGANPSGLPLSLVCELPTLGFPGGTQEMYQAAWDAAWELYNTVPEVAAEYKDVHPIGLFPVDPFYLASKSKEVRKPADFNGMKVGGSGQLMEIVTSNGGAKIQQVPPESYLNLDKGVTDATFITWGQVSPYKIGEVCNYYYEYPFSGGFLVILFNKAAWDGLTADEQKMVDEVWQEAKIQSFQGMLGEVAKGRQYLLDLGKTLTQPTDAEKAEWAKAAEASFAKFKADSVTNGVSPEVADKVLAKWQEIVAKYRK